LKWLRVKEHAVYRQKEKPRFVLNLDRYKMAFNRRGRRECVPSRGWQ
jgi:hypothetical protein